MTSTLQQEGGRKLRMSSAQVMRVAQDLYQNGYITYMRTDSTTLSETALNAARSQARQLYLGQGDSTPHWPAAELAAFIHAAKARITEILATRPH